MESTWDYIIDIIRLSNGKKSKLVHQPKMVIISKRKWTNDQKIKIIKIKKP